MTLSTVSSGAAWDTSPTKSTASARARSASDTASDAPPNAFAATLAAVLNPQPAQVQKDDSQGANSDLDASLEAIAGSARAATSASGVSSSARAGASAAPVTNVSSDADALNPEFRARLGRVVTRMNEEYGHSVEIVEGFRPQARQEFLYEQGRTRPGDVVTWTKSSKHTLGMAADVKVDGSYDNSVAYQQLAQVAAQEGLRTLGARDPGHIELPNRGGAAAWGSIADATKISEGVSRAVELALQGGAAPAESTTAAGDPNALNGLLSRMSHAGGSAPASLRVGVRRLIEPVLPSVPVISLAELPAVVNLHSVGMWELANAA